MKKAIIALMCYTFTYQLQAIGSLENSFSGAVQRGEFKEAQNFLEKGANINSREFGWGNTVLHTVAKKNNVKAVVFLISKGANVNLRNKESIVRGKKKIAAPQTPLHIAVLSNSVATAEILLKEGAKVNSKAIIRGPIGQRRMSPLSIARSLKMKQLLKKHGGTKFSKRYNLKK